MFKTIKRGDIYYANLNPSIGSEQAGKRPVIIISNNMGNTHSSTVITAALTHSQFHKISLPTHYLLRAENGLKFDSIVLLEQLRTIDKKRLTEFIGRLDENIMMKIDKALMISLGLKK